MELAQAVLHGYRKVGRTLDGIPDQNLHLQPGVERGLWPQYFWIPLLAGPSLRVHARKELGLIWQHLQQVHVFPLAISLVLWLML